jgi:hypothetical protein
MKLQILLLLWLLFFGIAVGDESGVRTDRGEGRESVDTLSLGEATSETEIVTIRFLTPEPIITKSNGGFDTKDGRTVTTYSVNTLSNGFFFTSDGDLYINNLYAGRFTAGDVLVFGSNRLWSNGIPCAMRALTDMQKKTIFDSGGMVFEPDGSKLIATHPWTIYLKPSGSDRTIDHSGGAFTLTEGMTVIRIEKGRLIVGGFDYGEIVRGQTIKIIDGVVSVKQEVRSPRAIAP